MSFFAEKTMGGARRKMSSSSMADKMAMVRSHKKSSGGISVGGISVGGKKHRKVKGGLMIKNSRIGTEGEFLRPMMEGFGPSQGLFREDEEPEAKSQAKIGGMVRRHRLNSRKQLHGGIPLGGMSVGGMNLGGMYMGGMNLGGRKHKKKGGMPLGGMVSDSEYQIEGGRKAKKGMSQAQALKEIKKILFPTKLQREKHGINFKAPEHHAHVMQILSILSPKMKGGISWGDVWSGIKTVAPMLL